MAVFPDPGNPRTMTHLPGDGTPRAWHPPYDLRVTDPDHASDADAGAVYDAAAEAYAGTVGTDISPATEAAVDRALLAAFAEIVGRCPGARVADVGCGPGRVAAFLAVRSVDAMGVDVSPGMLAVARRAHPGITFEEGRLTALPLADHSVAGVVCWYSIIHTPPDELGPVWAELARVLTPDGHLLVAFQAGVGEAVHRTEAYGTKAGLTSYRHSPDAVVRGLSEQGLHVQARTVREPELAHETAKQAFIVARSGSSPGLR